MIRFSTPIFDRKIDLKWFRDDSTEFYGSKLQKIDIPPKNRPKIGVFRALQAVNGIGF